MSVRQFAGELKKTIEELKAQGTAAIACDNLIAYLASVQQAGDSEPSQVQLEEYKARLQMQNDASKRAHESQLELFRSVISSAQAAIKTGFLLNGGAAVAMLAFIGHLAERSPEKVHIFALSLAPLTFGVLASALLSGLTYLTQWLYASPQQKAKRAGFGMNLLCIVVGFSSYGFFAWGMCRSYSAFFTLGMP